MRVFFLAIVLLYFAPSAFSQLLVRISSIPGNTPQGSGIYLAGNFQNWNPGDPFYQLKKTEEGRYEIEIQPAAGRLEFKFTRGSWASVEGSENGGPRPNRSYDYSSGKDTLSLSVLSWEDIQGAPTNSTASANVHMLDDDFFMSELQRERKIWIYLPPDYDSSQKHYPVLYMHDGQNLFDATTSFSGEWEVDESLNQLYEKGDYGLIVVAIENGQDKRLDEYSPWVNPTYGGGEGDEYIRFIVNTLKPYIDTSYRSLPGRKYTGIMGSSMGGLISLYAGIEYQEVFGKIGSFSPAYWFSPMAVDHVVRTGKEQDMRIYTIIGDLEGQQYVNSVTHMSRTLQEAGFGEEELKQEIHDDGQHSEWYWAREFPDAYQWLFADPTLSPSTVVSTTGIRIFPNPGVNQISISGLTLLPVYRAEIYSLDGKLIRSQKLQTDQLALGGIPGGVYFIHLLEGDRLLHAQKLVIAP